MRVGSPLAVHPALIIAGPVFGTWDLGLGVLGLWVVLVGPPLRGRRPAVLVSVRLIVGRIQIVVGLMIPFRPLVHR